MTTVTEPTLFDSPVAAPVDTDTASLLALVATDRIHADDARAVVEAIVRTASEHAGAVDPNRLRLVLRHGRQVCPQVIGSVVSQMKRRGVLEFAGWVITEGSTSGNNGRPARSYRLVKRPA